MLPTRLRCGPRSDAVDANSARDMRFPNLSGRFRIIPGMPTLVTEDSSPLCFPIYLALHFLSLTFPCPRPPVSSVIYLIVEKRKRKEKLALETLASTFPPMMSTLMLHRIPSSGFHLVQISPVNRHRKRWRNHLAWIRLA